MGLGSYIGLSVSGRHGIKAPKFVLVLFRLVCAYVSSFLTWLIGFLVLFVVVGMFSFGV